MKQPATSYEVLPATERNFIDAFAGCGGLSLGLLRSGWHGLLAIEKDPFAFATYSENLLHGRFADRYSWPVWLQQEPTDIHRVLQDHAADLKALRGKVALLAGGPPCQGFSSAGRRLGDDPRNGLIEAYLQLVELITPSVVLLENVRWISVDFQRTSSASITNYADYICESLRPEYRLYTLDADVSEYGVAQKRRRFILIAVHRESSVSSTQVLNTIDATRRKFLRRHGLTTPIAAASALSDLELSRNGSIACRDSPGFMAIDYSGPRTRYQRYLRDASGANPDNTRLARHSAEIERRFKEIIAECAREGRLNTSIGTEMRRRFGLNKQALRVLDPDRPAPTITSMPDDLLHYAEPRTLTVRETARLQAFPDWFSFRGKYTTGGEKRRREVPRFTQVANAVPPPVAEVLGEALMTLVVRNYTHNST